LSFTQKQKASFNAGFLFFLPGQQQEMLASM
jgi:hypothetical protein